MSDISLIRSDYDIVPIEVSELCNVPISELAKYGSLFRLTCIVDIHPGYNVLGAAIYGDSGAPYPMDKYSTGVELWPGSELKVVTRDYTYTVEEQVEVPEPNTLKRKLLGKTTKSEKQFREVKGTLCQLHIIPQRTRVNCSPESVPDYLKNSIGSNVPTILEEDVVILPDYSNIGPNIATTPDLYGIKILKGSEVKVHEGNHTGSVIWYVFNGRMIVNCNPDLRILCCAIPVEDPLKYFSDEDPFLQISEG